MNLDRLLDDYACCYHNLELLFEADISRYSPKYKHREEKLEVAKQKIHQYIRDNYEARN